MIFLMRHLSFILEYCISLLAVFFYLASIHRIKNQSCKTGDSSAERCLCSSSADTNTEDMMSLQLKKKKNSIHSPQSQTFTNNNPSIYLF